MTVILVNPLHCLACGAEIDIPTALAANSDVFFFPHAPLTGEEHAVFHWDCYSVWPDRVSFSRRHIEHLIASVNEDPFHGQAYLDEFSFVAVDRPGGYVEVRVFLFQTGSEMVVPLNGWAEWLVEEPAGGCLVHEFEREALLEARAALRIALPTRDSVLRAVNWAKKDLLLEQKFPALAEAQETEMRALVPHNTACNLLEQRRQTAGLTCPYCGQHSRRIRFLDKSPYGRSYFICRSCGRSFHPNDLEDE